jgi:hypothetical protein
MKGYERHVRQRPFTNYRTRDLHSLLRSVYMLCAPAVGSAAREMSGRQTKAS